MEAIKKQEAKVKELEIQFNQNPNSKSAKKLSDARVLLKNMELEYRRSPEYKENERKELSKELQEMVNKHFIPRVQEEKFIIHESELY